MSQRQDFSSIVEARKEEMASDMMEMSLIPAVNPRMNGTGEYARMQWIQEYLKKYSIPFDVIEVPDDAVKEGVRLNLVVRLLGSDDPEKTLWIIAHVDTVNSGDPENWNTDPFKPERIDGRIYGLGVEDNSQAVITALHTCRLVIENKLQTKCSLGFIFASDEETGSSYGLHALLDKGLFSPRDEAIVPDAGSADGSFVEIAEKSQVWLRITTTGKQAHASMPQLGINATSIGMHLGAEIEDTLKKEFNLEDPLFNPPYSTFELTQKFVNVDSPNVMPGKDVFVMDLRILPAYSVDQVMERIYALAKKYEEKRAGVTVQVEYITRVDAPAPTPHDSDVVTRLVDSIRETGVSAYYGGIGGATCGAILRAKNIPVAVWSTLDELAHQPNEYVVVDNLVKDTKVYMSTILKYC